MPRDWDLAVLLSVWKMTTYGQFWIAPSRRVFVPKLKTNYIVGVKKCNRINFGGYLKKVYSPPPPPTPSPLTPLSPHSLLPPPTHRLKLGGVWLYAITGQLKMYKTFTAALKQKRQVYFGTPCIKTIVSFCPRLNILYLNIDNY